MENMTSPASNTKCLTEALHQGQIHWFSGGGGGGRDLFLESPSNLPGLISVFGDKYFLTEEGGGGGGGAGTCFLKVPVTYQA